MLAIGSMRHAPFLLSLGVVCVCGVAAAQQAPCNPPCVAGQMCTTSGQCVPVVLAPPPPPPAPPPPPSSDGEREKQGEHTHDGFYFRLGLGVGYFAGSLDTSPKATISGAQLALDLAFGGTPVPGLVIGGGIYGSAAGAQWESAGVTANIGSAALSTVGPFVDWYPNPKDGWHLTGMFGLSRFVFTPDNGGSSATSTVGGAAMIGGGYEFWIGREWSLGFIARLQYAAATLHDQPVSVATPASISARVSAVEPALLVGLTFH
jgi:hypothetical protein